MKTTKRQQDAQRCIRMRGRSTAEVECLNCHATHLVDRDEDGGAEIEMQPCHDDDCTAMLCPACDQFRCDHCGLAYCKEHAVTYSGERVCWSCMSEAKRIDEDLDEAYQQLVVRAKGGVR